MPLRRNQDLLSTMRAVSLFFLKLIFVWPFKSIIWIIQKIKDRRYNVNFDDYPDEDEWIDDSDNEQQIQDEITKYEELPDIPEMCQVFSLGDICVGVEFVSMCPDETAHIRIIGDTTFSQLYKRRVYREKGSNARYFKLNNEKYYLDEKRTQPVSPIQAKSGK